jgi:hypothetical protein
MAFWALEKSRMYSMDSSVKIATGMEPCEILPDILVILQILMQLLIGWCSS